jgi:hypothetical protein
MTKHSSKKTTRQRRERRQQPETPEDQEANSDDPPSKILSQASGGDTEETVWQVIRRHPLFWALILVGIPYGLHLSYRWVVLQHPFLSTMRPAVTMSDPRQVLILGSMSSGTSSIAEELRTNFLEVGHEDSDSTWKFVRDGTVSWFHGIRYFPSTDRQRKLETIAQVCAISWHITSRKESSNYGFGPTLFGNPEYECSFWHPNFQQCYVKSCHNALLREYGCALEPEGCHTPFASTLLQTREPWKIITSLAAKYCFNDGTIDNTIYPDSLQWLLIAVGLISSSNPPAPCAFQMMQYVVNYYNTILDNASSSTSDIIVYSIEETTPCQISKLAGLDDPENALYLPNHDRYNEVCGEQNEKTKDINRSRSNAINKGRVSIADLLPSATPDMLKGIQDLYSRLGYTYPSTGAIKQ